MKRAMSSLAAWPRSRKLATAFLLLFALAMFALRVELIRGSLPYPLHVDEENFLQNAVQMLRNGTLRPAQYNWPTLPIYAVAATGAAAVAAETRAGRMQGVADLSDQVFPHYAQPAVVRPARLGFALLSVATLVLAGLLARGVTRSEWGLVLAPAIVSLNVLYLEHSWTYLNVDIVGCFAVVGALAYLVLCGDRQSSFLHTVAIPGILCGLAAATKYTNGAIALPFLLSMGFKSPRRLLTWGPAFFGILALAFLVAMPYAALDWESFSAWILKQRRIYASGWPGHTIEPGLPHLGFQLKELIRLFGAGVFALGCVGLIWLPLRRRREGLLLIAYPVAYTLYFSTYRVDFIRNLLPVHVVFAVCAAVGGIALGEWLQRRLRRIPLLAERPLAASITSALAIGLVLFGPAPWSVILHDYGRPVDSRNLAIEWIHENVPAGSRVVIAGELGLLSEPLAADYELLTVSFGARRGALAAIPRSTRVYLSKEKSRRAYYIVPEFGYDDRWPERKIIADGMNDLYAGGEVLARFGELPVLVRYNRFGVTGGREYLTPVPLGNPKLTVRRGPVVDLP
jgi:hypothetical protein